MKPLRLLILLAAFNVASFSASAQGTSIVTPKAHHPNIESVTLFAAEPDIVTPIGVDVAPDGRVFVQENHTHKREDDYTGPETDRILVFEDTDGDGEADKRSVFYEGLVYSTDLFFGPDGHLYVSNRWFVGRFPDAATKALADGEPEVLIDCETEGDYPHNGVGGLAIDPVNPDWLAFGFGENLGADYTFIGSDGTKLSGGAEGGSTYRCRTDGSQLERLSTGHWNAFGMTYDLDGNLWSTDNDPNSTPPNRLLHVVPFADFGYEYRYGRSGRHPLVTWYGENPGTIGMAGALGEAASGIISFGPNQLLTATWTDNRVDLHPLTQKGASFEAGREPFLTGPADFRPVHFAYSADGKYLYVTDWVKLSYPVHGHGRIWQVAFKEPVQLSPEPREEKPTLSPMDVFSKLGDPDPYVRTDAMRVIAENSGDSVKWDWQAEENATARAHYAVAMKRSGLEAAREMIPSLLEDPAKKVRFVGVKWIADDKLADYESQLEALLHREDLSRHGLLAVVAALDRISGGSEDEFSPAAVLLDLAQNDAMPGSIRALAVQSIPVDDEALTVTMLDQFSQAENVALQREAIRSLSLHPSPKRESSLARLAAATDLPVDLRADAIAGLSAFAEKQAALLRSLTEDSAVATEAERTLASAGLVQRDSGTKPLPTDIQAWVALVEEAPGDADLTNGHRLFFHHRLAGCFRCHSMEGRGLEVGPDLTTLHKQGGIDLKWLLKHIVDPNAQIAPYFRPLAITTTAGQSHLGFILGREGKKQGFVGPDGKVFFIDKEKIATRVEMPISLMPPGLLNPLTDTEIRDLTAYILNGSEGEISH